ncbi:unnamed protein product [Gadus morhua 'NCC']
MGHIAKACRGHKEGGYGKETRHLECCNALKHETCTDSSALKQQGRHVCSAPQHVDQSNAPQHVDQSNSPQHLDQSNAQNLRSNGDCIQPQPHSSREDYGLPKRSMVDAATSMWLHRHHGGHHSGALVLLDCLLVSSSRPFRSSSGGPPMVCNFIKSDAEEL